MTQDPKMIAEAAKLLAESSNSPNAVLITILLAGGLLLGWLIKWICGRFATSVDNCAAVVSKTNETTTQLALRVEALGKDHQATSLRLSQEIAEAPEKTADILQRRKLA